MAWKISRYNHTTNLNEGKGLLYNGRTGAVVELTPGIYRDVLPLFTVQGDIIAPRRHSRLSQIFPYLIAGGFLVKKEFDELASLEETYERERQRSQFLLTILPTFGS